MAVNRSQKAASLVRLPSFSTMAATEAHMLSTRAAGSYPKGASFFTSRRK